MKRGFKIFIGDCIHGRVFAPYTIGVDYDFEYRLCHIKADINYTSFYYMCPLFGPEFAGNTIDQACDYLDNMHEEDN